MVSLSNEQPLHIQLPVRGPLPGRPTVRARRWEMLVDPVSAVIRSCVADSFTSRPSHPMTQAEVRICLNEEQAAGLPLLGLTKVVLDGIELARIVGNDRTVGELEVKRIPMLESSVHVEVISPEGEVFQSTALVHLGNIHRPVSLDHALVAFAPDVATRLGAVTAIGTPTSWATWRQQLRNVIPLHIAAGNVMISPNLEAQLSECALYLTAGSVLSDLDNIAAMTLDLMEAARSSLHQRRTPMGTRHGDEVEYVAIERLIKGINVSVRQQTNVLDARLVHVEQAT